MASHAALRTASVTLLGLALACAMEFTDSFDVDPNAYDPLRRNPYTLTFETFGFNSGGSFSLKLHLDTAQEGMWIAGCTGGQRNEMWDDPYACLGDWTPPCHLWSRVPDNATEAALEHRVGTNAVLHAMFVVCSGARLSGSVDGWFLNPHGEQLDARDAPLKYLYAILVGLWTVIAAAWCANWTIYRNQKCALHRAITVFPVVKFVWMALCTALFFTLSRNGRWKDERGFLIAYYVLLPFEDVVIFAILLLISHGWGIVTSSMNKRFLSYSFVSLSALLFLKILGLWFSGFFSLLAWIAFVVLIVIVVLNINRNIIEYREHLSRQAEDRQSKDYLKLQMFVRYRLIILFFIIGMCIVNGLGTLLALTVYLWVSELLRQVLFLGLFISIAITFRLRPHNIYYLLNNDEDDVPAGHNVVNVAPADLGTNAGPVPMNTYPPSGAYSNQAPSTGAAYPPSGAYPQAYPDGYPPPAAYTQAAPAPAYPPSGAQAYPAEDSLQAPPPASSYPPPPGAYAQPPPAQQGPPPATAYPPPGAYPPQQPMQAFTEDGMRK